MSLSMHQASAPVFHHQFGCLIEILNKGAAHATARKIDPAVLIGARLYPDMLPLSKQVQIAADMAKGAVARLAGIDAPTFEDNETTFEQLTDRCARTRAFLDEAPAGLVDGSEDKEIVLAMWDRTLTFTGQHYLLGFALPNFFFHIATAYAILRHNGVELGKRDFLGAI
jgi:hypothetical protein